MIGSPRRNSQLVYPPAMEERIVAFLRDNRAAFAGADNPRHQRGPRHPLVTASVPLDLTGVPDHYPKQAMLTYMPSVPVRIYASRPGDPAGSWTSYPRAKRGVSIYVRPGIRVESFRPTLQHELRHMVQTLLGDAMGANPNAPAGQYQGASGGRGRAYGIPAGDWRGANQRLTEEVDRLKEESDGLSRRSSRAQEIATRLRYLEGKYGPRYYLAPVEFYPHLGNLKDKMLGLRGSGSTAQGSKADPITARTFAVVRDQSDLLNTLREFAPDLYRKAIGELRAWADAHNADLKAAADRRPLTTTRIVSDLQDRLDKTDPVLAAELRANRDRYEALARSLVH